MDDIWFDSYPVTFALALRRQENRRRRGRECFVMSCNGVPKMGAQEMIW